MKLVSGVLELDLPGLFAAAQRRIILHAAVYGPFAKSELHSRALEIALSNGSFSRLDVIYLSPNTDSDWCAPFLSALRHGVPENQIGNELIDSMGFLEDLVAEYPDKVYLHQLKSQPFQPIVIVDDFICFGQYADCSIPAPSGFWGMVEADVEKLIAWSMAGNIPEAATAEEISSYRLIADCVGAMTDCPVILEKQADE